MAANSGVKIFRDFLRDSPCRMAYLMSQPKNFTSKSQHLAKVITFERPGTARPKTAPMAASPLAHAITAHNIIEETPKTPQKRPTTSGRILKPSLNSTGNDLSCAGSRKPDGKSPRHPPVAPRQRPRRPSDPPRKTPSASSNKDDIRKRPHQQKKQLGSPHPGRDSPKKPCKICISGEDCAVAEQWQDLLLNAHSLSSNSKSSDGFRHLIEEIERIRSELVAREEVKNIGLEESIELINEIQHRINSLSPTRPSGDSYLNRLAPFQTAMRDSEKRATIKAKKSVRSLRFEGGRILEQDYSKLSRQRADGATETVRKGKTRQIEKKFDEGPLRCLLPFVNGSLKAKQVKF
ncbi:uncharacterized protein LOC134223686 [Armigeres subalbatus]|uniref:uncharacterized protein LOC134223686 n=1 Tax=Armigeres subalbatus TaxID=124917 RepID=UPI002ED4D12D